jgi:hypothetical protein
MGGTDESKPTAPNPITEEKHPIAMVKAEVDRILAASVFIEFLLFSFSESPD